MNAATNQLTGYSYDANGNLITTGFGWDPENRMSYATFGGTQYAYDSANKRIWTGNYTCPGGFCGPGYGWQFQSETVFFYGIDGKQLASYTPQVKYSYGMPQSIYYLLGEERVYFGKYIGNANTSLMSGGTSIGQDRLGSTGKYFPFGEERNNPQLPNDTVKFASYTRDSATGLDYADQRYFTSGIGRFLSPDRYVASGGPADPSSWNRYAYTRGDPVNRYDPSGLYDVVVPPPPQMPYINASPFIVMPPMSMPPNLMQGYWDWGVSVGVAMMAAAQRSAAATSFSNDMRSKARKAIKDMSQGCKDELGKIWDLSDGPNGLLHKADPANPDAVIFFDARTPDVANTPMKYWGFTTIVTTGQYLETAGISGFANDQENSLGPGNKIVLGPLFFAAPQAWQNILLEHIVLNSYSSFGDWSLADKLGLDLRAKGIYNASDAISTYLSVECNMKEFDQFYGVHR